MRYLTSLIFALALALSVAFVACGGAEADCAEPVADPTGRWSMTRTPIEETCVAELPPPDNFFMTIFQEGSDLATFSPYGLLKGTICGDQVRMSGEGSRGDFTVTGNMELSISVDGNSVEGSFTGTYTSPTQNCRGKHLLSGYRF